MCALPDAGAPQLGALLGVLRMALCTSAASIAAHLITDMYPVVAGALSLELPPVAPEATEGGDTMVGDDDAPAGAEAGQGVRSNQLFASNSSLYTHILHQECTDRIRVILRLVPGFFVALRRYLFRT
jgi:hypothetical protein